MVSLESDWNRKLSNPRNLTLEIIEVQSCSDLGEDVIVRFEDIYGRANS